MTDERDEVETAETAETEQAAGAGQEKRPLTDEERAALLREQLKALHVADMAQDMMLSLVTVGYQKLGLTDQTRELRDLDDARLAIELLRGVLEALGAVAGEQLVAPFRSTLAAMQMSFAQAAASESSDESPAASAAAPAATRSDDEGEGEVADTKEEPEADQT